MASLHTTHGRIDSANLGFVLPHEHVMICSPDVRQVWPASFDEGHAVERSVSRLRAAKAAGVGTFIDVTTIDFGRDAAFIERVALEADLPVAVSTGLWNVPILFQYRDQALVEQFFLKEITDGIEGSTLTAALIKITTNGPTLSPIEEKVFRAAGRAHRQTGVPITTHTEASTRGGLDQQRVLADERVDLRRVVIGHSETDDYDYLQLLLARGSYLGLDRFGADNIEDPEAAIRRGRPNHAQRLRSVTRLCQDGYASQVLLSHDTAGISVFPTDWWDRTFPNSRFDYIPLTVLDELRAAGVSDRDITLMTRENAQRLFSTQTPY